MCLMTESRMLFFAPSLVEATRYSLNAARPPSPALRWPSATFVRNVSDATPTENTAEIRMGSVRLDDNPVYSGAGSSSQMGCRDAVVFALCCRVGSFRRIRCRMLPPRLHGGTGAIANPHDQTAKTGTADFVGSATCSQHVAFFCCGGWMDHNGLPAPCR